MTVLRMLARNAHGMITRGWSATAPRIFKIHERLARYTRAGAQPILESHEGADPHAASQDYAVFVHFDSGGAVHDYVVTHLKELSAAGFRVWFMSNAPRLDAKAIARVSPYVAKIKRRNNFGYDFGAYKDGVLEIMANAAPRRLVLCNDSVYGPFLPLGPLLERAKSDEADIWGMTDSYDKRYHLQSYFVLYHERALARPEFRAFWASAPYVDARGWLIYFGEIGLTQAMMRGDLRIKALFAHEDVARALRRDLVMRPPVGNDQSLPINERRIRDFHDVVRQSIDGGVPLNSTHFCWDILIEQLGYPYIKRDLLQYNRSRIPTLATWQDVVRKMSNYDVEQIQHHLRQRLRSRFV